MRRSNIVMFEEAGAFRNTEGNYINYADAVTAAGWTLITSDQTRPLERTSNRPLFWYPGDGGDDNREYQAGLSRGAYFVNPGFLPNYPQTPAPTPSRFSQLFKIKR